MSTNINEKSFSKSSSSDKTSLGFIVGVNNTKDTTIKAYVPKLMSQIEMGNTLYNKKVKVKNSLTNANFDLEFTDVTEKNYIYLSPIYTTGLESRTYFGERINVSFVDNNLTKGRFEEYKSDNEETNSNRNIRYRQFINAPSFVDDGGECDHEYIEDDVVYLSKKKITNNKTKNQIAKNTAGKSASNNKKKTPLVKTGSRTKLKKKSNKKKINNSSANKNVKGSKGTVGTTIRSSSINDRYYDIIMDNSSQIMGMRLGTKDNSGSYIEENDIMSILFNRKTNSVRLNNLKQSQLFMEKDKINLFNKRSSLYMNNKLATLTSNNNFIEIDGTGIYASDYITFSGRGRTNLNISKILFKENDKIERPTEDEILALTFNRISNSVSLHNLRQSANINFTDSDISIYNSNSSISLISNDISIHNSDNISIYNSDSSILLSSLAEMKSGGCNITVSGNDVYLNGKYKYSTADLERIFDNIFSRLTTIENMLHISSPADPRRKS